MEYQRKLVSQLRARLQEPRKSIQIVAGPRQTGKITAVLQTLSYVQVLQHFVSADDPTLISQTWLKNEWEQACQLCQRHVDGAVFVVDEIQRIPGWSEVVKLLWDEDTRLKIPLKVALTGSSSLLMQKGMHESLMGRFEVLYCQHWNLQECRGAFGYNLEEIIMLRRVSWCCGMAA